MAEAPLEPIAVWQKFVTDWERQVNQASARVAGTEEFGRAMNHFAMMSVAAQQQFDKHMEQVLKTVNVASKTDIAALENRLAAIEESLDRLALLIEKKDQPVKKPVPRTRQPAGEK